MLGIKLPDNNCECENCKQARYNIYTLAIIMAACVSVVMLFEASQPTFKNYQNLTAECNIRIQMANDMLQTCHYCIPNASIKPLLWNESMFGGDGK